MDNQILTLNKKSISIKKEENNLENIAEENNKDINPVIQYIDTDSNRIIQNPNLNINKIINVKLIPLTLLAVNASLGFFFMGYNLVVFNTMSDFLQLFFAWNEETKVTLIAVCSTIVPIGALFGSFFTGMLSNKIGRKNTFLLLDLIGIIGGGISCIGSTTSFIIGRFIMGLATGGFSTVVPKYIQEYIPLNLIGRYGVLYNLIFSVGIVIAFLLGLNLPAVNNSKNTDELFSNSWWRLMILFPCIINLINLANIIFIFKYDTPYFYIINDKIKEAKEAYSKIYDCEIYIIEEIEKIKTGLNSSDGTTDNISYRQLFTKRYLWRLVIGILLNVGQQTSAINVFAFYSNSIYIYNEPTVNATLYTSFLSFTELLGNILSLIVIEKLGRKVLFIIGFTGVFICLLIMTILYYLSIASELHKYFVIVYYFFVGLSTDPVIWILTADLLPEIGVGICAAFNWSTVILVIFSFPYMMPKENLGLLKTMTIYTSITFAYLIFNTIFLKETKGKTIKEIEVEYKICN